MDKRIGLLLTAVCLIGWSTGCHSHKSDADTETETTVVTDTAVPADSSFAKIHVGMSQERVFAAIGMPTSIDEHQTGKAWNPFHYSGHDDFRKIAYYKGAGYITFSNNSAYTSGFSVKNIHYDPTNSGYSK